MAQSVDSGDSVRSERIYREYALDIRIDEVETEEGETRYRFEAPEHTEMVFSDPEQATLYADVYFAVNGFVEEGTGHRGLPPEVVQDGKDTMAAYLVTQTSVGWVASFYGAEPTRVERYIDWVRGQAEEIRNQARETQE